MKKHLVIGLLAGVFILQGCASVSSPVMGSLYTNVKAPINATAANASSQKSGKATCSSLFGLFAWGDCSIEAAKKEGGVASVVSVDSKSVSYLGLFSTYTTIVSGE